MKKITSIFIALSAIFALSVCLHANPLEYVEETYLYRDAAMEWFGWHKYNEDGSLVHGEALLDGGIWSYEYYDTETKTFHPMSAYFPEAQSMWAHGGWSKFYTATVESAWENGPLTYCSIGNEGKRMHPSDGAGAVISFMAPVSGVISFDASIAPYGTHTSVMENGGDAVALFLNDTRIWPEKEEDGYFYSDTASKVDPMVIDVNAFEVEAGDRVRLVLTTKPGTNRGSKGCEFVDLPMVTYHSASVRFSSTGEPMLPRFYRDPTLLEYEVIYGDIVVKKDPRIYAMNLYLNGEKVDIDPVTDDTYTLSGFRKNTTYILQVEVVTETGQTYSHEPYYFRIKNGYFECFLQSECPPADAFAKVGQSVEPAVEDLEKTSDSATWIAGSVTLLCPSAVLAGCCLSRRKKG